MINVALNGEIKPITPGSNLQQLLDEWQLVAKNFAIAINQQFIPRSAYTETVVNDGDSIELLVPMQGG